MGILEYCMFCRIFDIWFYGGFYIYEMYIFFYVLCYRWFCDYFLIFVGCEMKYSLCKVVFGMGYRNILKDVCNIYM